MVSDTQRLIAESVRIGEVGGLSRLDEAAFLYMLGYTVPGLFDEL